MCRKLKTILIQVSSSVYVCARSGWTNTITFSATVQQHIDPNGANHFSLQAVLRFHKFSKQLDEVGPGLKNLLYLVKQLAKYTNKYQFSLVEYILLPLYTRWYVHTCIEETIQSIS